MRTFFNQWFINLKFEDKGTCSSSGPVYEDLTAVKEYERSGIDLESNPSYDPLPTVNK